MREKPEINELLLEIQGDVNSVLGGRVLTEHLGANNAFGLPFPHLDEVVEAELTLVGEGDKKYNLPELRSKAVKRENEAQLISTQINSLCIKREKPQKPTLKLDGLSFVAPSEMDKNKPLDSSPEESGAESEGEAESYSE